MFLSVLKIRISEEKVVLMVIYKKCLHKAVVVVTKNKCSMLTRL